MVLISFGHPGNASNVASSKQCNSWCFYGLTPFEHFCTYSRFPYIQLNVCFIFIDGICYAAKSHRSKLHLSKYLGLENLLWIHSNRWCFIWVMFQLGKYFTHYSKDPSRQNIGLYIIPREAFCSYWNISPMCPALSLAAALWLAFLSYIQYVHENLFSDSFLPRR